MLNLFRIFKLIYKAMKMVDVINEDGSAQVYHGVESEEHIFFVVSKNVCDKYGLTPEINFVKYTDGCEESCDE